MNYDENSRILHIVALFRTNGLTVPKGLEELTKSADYASDGCKEVAGLAYQTLIGLFNAAFENGINSSVKDALYGSADAWSKLASPKAVSKLNRYEQTILESEKKINQGREPKMNIRDVIIKYIDETVSGNNIIAEGPTSIPADVLQAGKEKLIKLKAVVERTLDASSKTANDLAVRILGTDKSGLLGYRISLQNHLLTKANAGYIDEAIELAMQWASIVKIPDKRERLKNGEGIEYREDSFSIVLRTKDVKAVAERFFAVLDERKKAVEEVDSLQNEITSLLSRNAKIQTEIAEWDKRVDNGECSVLDADNQIMALEEEERDNKEEISSRRMTLSVIREQIRFSVSIVHKYEMLKGYYKTYERLAPSYFYGIFSQIPYNEFMLILSGDATAEQQAKANISLDAALMTIKDRTEKLKGVVHGFDSVLEDHKRAESVRQDGRTQMTEEQEALERRNKRIAQRQARAETERSPLADKSPIETSIPLNINDN